MEINFLEQCPLCGHEGVTTKSLPYLGHFCSCNYCRSTYETTRDDKDYKVITDNTDRIPYECIDPALR